VVTAFADCESVERLEAYRAERLRFVAFRLANRLSAMTKVATPMMIARIP
jgi:hypothetical protein